MARENDSLRYCELHSKDAIVLREYFSLDRRVKVEERGLSLFLFPDSFLALFSLFVSSTDGFEAVIAYLPPIERSSFLHFFDFFFFFFLFFQAVVLGRVSSFCPPLKKVFFFLFSIFFFFFFSLLI